MCGGGFFSSAYRLESYCKDSVSLLFYQLYQSSVLTLYVIPSRRENVGGCVCVRIMPCSPKDVHILIPVTYPCYLYDTRDFTDMMLRILSRLSWIIWVSPV